MSDSIRVKLVCAIVVFLTPLKLMAVEVVLTAVKDSGLYLDDPGSEFNDPTPKGDSNRGIGGRADINLFGDGMLVQFDLSGVTIDAGEEILSATLELASASSTPAFQVDLVAYPLADSWGEGTGAGSSGSGDLGFPWGPASVGDAVYNFKSVTTTRVGTAADFDFQGETLADTGTAWNTAGGRGIGADVVDRKLFDVNLDHEGVSQTNSFDPISFNASGRAVLTDMINGVLANNGFNIWEKNFTEVREDFAQGMRVITHELADLLFDPSLAPTLRLDIGVPTFDDGDFDQDGDVDGIDFLIWQRGEVTNPPLTSDLVLWETNYGNGGGPLSAVAAVPEPSSLVLLIVGVLGLATRKRR